MIWKIFTYVMLAAVFAGEALAADDGYNPDAIEAKDAWIKWVFVVVFVIGIGVAAFKNPKRTHLD